MTTHVGNDVELAVLNLTYALLDVLQASNTPSQALGALGFATRVILEAADVPAEAYCDALIASHARSKAEGVSLMEALGCGCTFVDEMN